jgi:hypothetical protein
LSAPNRLLAPLLLAAIVAATLVAFLIVERERNHPTIIEKAHVTREFSPDAPVGSSSQRLATARFLLTHAEPHATIVVLNSDGAIVKTLAADVSLPDDSRQRYVWNGTTDSGSRAPPGDYSLQVRLGDLGRNLPLPTNGSVRLVGREGD